MGVWNIDESEAYGLYNDALEQWERGDDDGFYESAAELNEWLHAHDASALMPEDWYPDSDFEAEAMWEWIETLDHEDREHFFGY